jgi:hemerythrin-like domain-containing protein
MKIIDPETGKRLDGKGMENPAKLKDIDPIRRNAEKDLEAEEHSPMDPPDAYDKRVVDVAITQAGLQQLIKEHEKAIAQIDAFENALRTFKEGGYRFTRELNDTFGAFFEYFDSALMPHNRREEKALFPILHRRLIEDGEAGNGPQPKTAIDIMEDDHVKFIQLGVLSFNLLGLGTRVPDQTSGMIVMDAAFDAGRELCELLRLHIFREDNTLFPLAEKLLKDEDWNEVNPTLVSA